MIQSLITYSPLLYFTQSIWRDEAFSILVAEKPVSFFFGNLSFEPPLYYMMLHYWMKLFGNSEIAVRSLSLLGFALATVVVIFWAEKLFKKHWLSWFLSLFFFLNPMLLYYAFEVRTYGWYTFFATLSFYSYMEKKWSWYTAAAILGFYTHSYFLVVPGVTALHYLATNPHVLRFRRFTTIVRDPMLRSLGAIVLFIAPWITIILKEATRLKQSWYYPVDLHLIRSVLGNMFVGYEGTPWYLWQYTAVLSLFLLALFLYALVPRETRKRNLFFFLMVFTPLVLVIGISFLKPLFVNRYLLPVVIAEVLLVACAIETIKHKGVQAAIASGALVFVIGFNVWYPSQHAKLNIRDTLMQVNALRGKNDVILAQSPLVLFESIYYSNDRNAVYLYNPKDVAFPWYVGDAVFSPKFNARDLPPYPIRAFIIHQDGTYALSYNTEVTYRRAPKPTATPIQP